MQKLVCGFSVPRRPHQRHYSRSESMRDNEPLLERQCFIAFTGPAGLSM
jgi:hypothetical protein